LRMVALYGQPSDEWEWLGAYTERNATDIRLAGGERLTASASANSSHLLKLGWFPHPAFWGELSLVGYRSGPQRAPYDANTDEPGSFGLVRRTVDDQTLTLRTQLAPADSWLNLRTVIAHENTRLTDLALQSDNGVTYDLAVSSLRGPGDKTDHWRYDIWSAEVFNDTAWQAGEFKGVLTLGWQGLRNARTLERLTQNPTWNSPTGAYPNGFYPAQPPGTKTSQGWVAEHALTWQGFTLTPGARWDRYTLEATGGARTALQAAMQSPKLSFSQVSSSLRLSWQPDLWQRQWVFTLSQADAFRPPLIDEAFTSGAYSRCLPSSGSVHFPLYDASLGQDKAPASGACGDLYRPQVSTTRELAVAWQPRATLLGARWQAKVATFRVKTRDTLNSLSAHDGVIDQPGREHRRGLEVDVRADAPRWFGTLGHAKVAGQVSAAGLSLTQSYNGPLYDVPGATTTLSLGLKNPASTWEAGLRLRDIQDRSSLVYQTATACSTAGTTRVNGLGYLGTQYGVQLTDLFATYRLSLQQPQDTALRLSVDNLTDELYCLNDGLGGGVGTQAAGRNIKVQVSWQW
jgi:hemoglobin/transferrin/lactoferrin receptor protein